MRSQEDRSEGVTRALPVVDQGVGVSCRLCQRRMTGLCSTLISRIVRVKDGQPRTRAENAIASTHVAPQIYPTWGLHLGHPYRHTFASWCSV